MLALQRMRNPWDSTTPTQSRAAWRSLSYLPTFLSAAVYPGKQVAVKYQVFPAFGLLYNILNEDFPDTCPKF